MNTSVSSVTFEIQGLNLPGKVTKKTLVDLQKRFLIHPGYPIYSAAKFSGGSAILLVHEEEEITLVDWERPLRTESTFFK